MRSPALWIPLILVLTIAFSSELSAQCAMCKAVVESGQQSGSNVATGLNSGIVYLMMFPYLLLGAVGFAIYRHKRKAKA